MKTRLTFLPLLFIFLLNFPLQATHLVGGSINYRHLTGNSYEVTATLYRDCSGITAPSVVSFFATSSCSNIGIQLDSVSAGTLQYCASILNSCNGGTMPGVEWIHYADTVQLPPCSDWVLDYELCCRNTSVNIMNSTAESFYLATTLDNSNGPNSSPIFNQSLNLIAEYNQPFCINNNAFDPDGDSLVYSLVSPLGVSGNPLTFNSPYTVNNPMGPGSNFSFNTSSGNMCFTANALGNFVTAVRVDEYRNGSIIGSTIRDIQVSVINGVSLASQDILGTLYDDQGNPVSGATVELLEYGISQGTLNVAATQTTNATGDYNFTAQNVGQYLVRAQSTGNFMPTYHQSTAYWQYAQMIYSMCDAQITADITYVDINNLLGTGVISGYLNGTGVFRAGDPIEGVNVLLYDLQTESLVQNNITNIDGYFELENIPSGSYYILVDAEGLAMVSTHFIDIQDGEIIENANFFIDEDGVYATGNYESTGFVDVNDFKQSQFKVYPNPGSDVVKVKHMNGEKFEMTMFSVSGKKVKQVDVTQETTLDVSDLESGIYIIELQHASSKETLKWIKD